MQKSGSTLVLLLKSVLAISLTLSACTATKETTQPTRDTKPFTILEASFEDWQAGRPEGGSGTDYRFTAVINTEKALWFDSVWIREKALLLPLTAGRLKGPATNKAFTFLKGDTIALFAATSSETPPSKKVAGPADLSTEAIFSYRIAGQKGHEAISKLTRKESLPRPRQ